MFYERLKAICDSQHTTITAVVKAVNGSTGSIDGWKKGRAPSSDIVFRMAKYLNVSTDYLLGLSDHPSVVGENTHKLDDMEATLIDRLRRSDPQVREIIMKMSFAVLPAMENDAFLPSNDAESHHEKVKFGAKTRTLLKKIEGEAAAGAPITAVPEEDSFVSVPEKYLDERYFIVRARGDSMEDTISNGACCVFQRGVPLDDGAIALVQIEGATDQPDDTIKRVYRRGKQVELCSDNPKHDSMLYPAKSVQIAGILVAVLEKDR